MRISLNFTRKLKSALLACHPGDALAEQNKVLEKNTAIAIVKYTFRIKHDNRFRNHITCI